MRILTYLFLAIFSLGILASAGIVIYVISYYGQDLPSYSQLKEYQHPALTEKGVFRPVETIPDQVKHAFIAAEDPDFYVYKGDVFVNSLVGIISAMLNGR